MADDGRTANENGFGQAFIQHDLRGAQHAFVFAFGKANAFFATALGCAEHRFHGGTRGIHQRLQFFAVGVHVGDGALRHAAGNRCLHHGRRNLHHQARVKRFGNQVFGAERQGFTGIGSGHHFTLLGLRQFSDGVHCSHFHLWRDGGRACIQRTAKNVRETQDVVDLVRVVGATGGHDGVIAHFQHFFWQYFRGRIGQGQNQRPRSHGLDHLGFEHATGGQAQEHIRVGDHLAQSAGRGFLHKLNFVLVHQLCAALKHHAGQVSHPNIAARHAQFHQHAQASQRRRACARSDQFHLGDVLAHHFEAVEDGRAHHDRGAVLVVMEHRYLHALAQFALNIKTIRCFDVF